jgi:hypothetical protein
VGFAWLWRHHGVQLFRQKEDKPLRPRHPPITIRITHPKYPFNICSRALIAETVVLIAGNTACTMLLADSAIAVRAPIALGLGATSCTPICIAVIRMKIAGPINVIIPRTTRYVIKATGLPLRKKVFITM